MLAQAGFVATAHRSEPRVELGQKFGYVRFNLPSHLRLSRVLLRDYFGFFTRARMLAAQTIALVSDGSVDSFLPARLFRTERLFKLGKARFALAA